MAGSRQRRLTWSRRFLVGALLLLLALGIYKVRRVWVLASSLQGRLDELQLMLDGNGELSAIGRILQDAQTDLKALQGEVETFLPLTRYMDWVPVVGGDLKTAPVLLEIAHSAIEAGNIAFAGMEPAITLVEGGATDEQLLPRVLGTLLNARPKLEEAGAQISTALQRRTAVDDSILSPRTVDLLAELDRYLPLMQTAFDGTLLVPELLGASERKAYLIIVQNADELRATGGFISAVGKLTVKDGEITDIIFNDSYAVDDYRFSYPDPPPAFARYMGIDQWVFRDANWSPDFPISAQRAVELYRISQALEVDGVLAVDQYALQAIVAAIEPLAIAGWPEPVTGENVIRLIQLAWSPTEVESWSGFDLPWWQQRKQFMNELIIAMRARVETTPQQTNWLKLAQSLFRVMDQRHMQLWLTDPTDPAASLLAELGWDGAIRQTASDYLMVVDSNLGYNKANAIVKQRLDYRVVIDVDGNAQSTLTVHHSNPSLSDTPCDPRPHYGSDYEAIINRCYWDYLRVYVPSGSKLFAATAHPTSADLILTGHRQSGAVELLPDENGKSVFATYFVLPHGQENETRYVYQLPQHTLERTSTKWRYRLWVQKQAGTRQIPLHVALVLPPGAHVQAVETSDAVRIPVSARQPEPNVVHLDVALEKDLDFEVSFLLGER